MTCHRLFGRVVGATCYTTVNKYNIGGQIGGNLWTRHDSLCFSGPPSQTVCRHETTCRAVGARDGGGSWALPDFDRSVNPISTKEHIKPPKIL